jgi:hypothetical protein
VTTVAVGTPALVTWVVLALLLGLVLGATAATLVARRPAGRGDTSAGDDDGDDDGTPPADAGTRTALDVDDLPGFLEHPPGSPGPAPTPPPPAAPASPAPAAAAGATAVRAVRRSGAGRHSPDASSTRSTLLAMVVAAVVLVLVAVLISLVGGDGPAADGPPASSSAPATPAGAATPVEAPGQPVLTARASFGTVLLERRRVGVTVTRPGLSVSSDGDRAGARVLLPTYNCLLREPPPDPEAAGCVPAATEYAELSGTDLRLIRDGDRVDLAGLLATYTQPPTGPPAYTGRSYRLGVTLAADGPERAGGTTARGLLRLGGHSTTTTGDPGANVLQLSD